MNILLYICIGVCSGTLYVGPGRAGPDHFFGPGRASSEQQSAYKECHIYILKIRILLVGTTEKVLEFNDCLFQTWTYLKIKKLIQKSGIRNLHRK